jgi:F0F1-type ATP synthase assembly protein I
MRVAATTEQGASMLSLIIGILIICVVGAICFWLIDKFVNESRLAGLLKLLVGLVCLAAILQRLLPLAGINWL